MRRFVLALAVLAAAVPTAAADEIQLTNGRKIVGVVVPQKDASKVVVEVGAGTITLPAKEVSAVNPGRTALHEYRERWDAVKGSTDAGELWALARWAREKGLTRHAAELALRTIELAPDHAGARAELRHEKIDGKWLTFDQAQESRGLLWTGDRWVTQAERALQERRRLEARERAEAAERERAARREEERLRRQAAIDEHNARMAAVMESMDGYFYSPSFAFTTPYYRPYWYAPYLRSRSYYQRPYEFYGYGAVPTFDLFRFAPNPYVK